MEIDVKDLQKLFEEDRVSHDEMKDSIKDLFTTVNDLKSDIQNFKETTKDLIIAFESLKGAVNVILWVGKIIKPLAIISVFITGLVVYFQNIDFTQYMPKGK